MPDSQGFADIFLQRAAFERLDSFAERPILLESIEAIANELWLQFTVISIVKLGLNGIHAERNDGSSKDF